MENEEERLLDNENVPNIVDKSNAYENILTLAGFGFFQWRLLFICGWALCSDSVEVLAVSFLLPSAQCDLHLTSFDKGSLNACVFLGMILGGIIFGTLADMYGRRKVLCFSLLLNGFAALSSSFVQTFWLFLVSRTISGIGVGGSMPAIFCYFIEFIPMGKRGSMISLLATFWMAGNIFTAALAWAIIPHRSWFSEKFHSWRLFVVLCSIPSLTSFLTFFVSPESPKLLLMNGNLQGALNSLTSIVTVNGKGFCGTKKCQYSGSSTDLQSDLRTLSCHVMRDNSRNAPSTGDTGSGRWLSLVFGKFFLLFSSSLRHSTLHLSVVFFTLAFGYYGLWMWFPEIFSRVEQHGGSICAHSNVSSVEKDLCGDVLYDVEPYRDGLFVALSNLPANLFTFFFLDKWGRKIALVGSLLLSSISVLPIPFVKTSGQNVAVACLFGAVTTVSWNTLDVLAPELYPTTIRSSALGFMLSLARLGAILGNLVFGEMLDLHCVIPLLIVSFLLLVGSLAASRLPEMRNAIIQ